MRMAVLYELAGGRGVPGATVRKRPASATRVNTAEPRRRRGRRALLRPIAAATVWCGRPRGGDAHRPRPRDRPAVRDGVIAAIGDALDEPRTPSWSTERDCTPSRFATARHCAPGAGGRGGHRSGTRAAAAGGFCAILAQPTPTRWSIPRRAAVSARARKAEARIRGLPGRHHRGPARGAAHGDGRARGGGGRRLHRRRPARALRRRDAPGASVPAPGRAAPCAPRGGSLAGGRRRDARGRRVGAAGTGRHTLGLGVDAGGARLRAGGLRAGAHQRAARVGAQTSRRSSGRRPRAPRSPARHRRTTCCSPTKTCARSTRTSR